MNRLRTIWGALYPPERLAIGLIALALTATAVAAAVAAVHRPGDISNANVEFDEADNIRREPKQPPKKGEDKGIAGAIGWRYYGYNRARTKFLDAPRLRPPFRLLWQYHRGELIEFAPIAVKGRLFGIDNDGVWFALRASKGTTLWKRKLGALNASTPAYARGTLFGVHLEPAQAIAVDAKTGKVRWRRQLPGRAESSPVVVGRRVYFGTESGAFFALDTDDGSVIWQTQLKGATKAAPAFDDGTLYVGDYAGEMYAIRADDGRIRWTASDLGAGFGRSGRFYSTAAVAFGRVYVGNVDGRVYSFSAKTGEIAWTFSAGDFVYSGIAIADTPRTDPAVYFGSHDRFFYSLDAKDGSLIWKRPAGGQVSGPATVIGPLAYVSTFNGNSTSGFDIKSGRKAFKIQEGEYGPVVSNGRLVYVIGDDTITAMQPIKQKRRSGKGGGTKLKDRPGTKGIIGAAPRRTGRSKR